MSTQIRNISPFHKEIAKRIAKGLKNQEIMREMNISASRLGVLKSNPLFKRIIDQYRERFDDAYFKAQEKFEEKATQIAESLTTIALNAMVDPRVRADVGFKVLDNLAATRGVSAKSPGTSTEESTLSFEQTLKLIRRKEFGDSTDDPTDTEALKQLTELEQEDSVEDSADLTP